METNLLALLVKNPEITLKGKNVWLPGYEISFDFREDSYSDGKSSGVITESAKNEFFKVLGTINHIPEPEEPLRKVKVDCNYELLLFGREMHYTNYHFQVNPQLTNFQRALLKLADACGLKVY